MMYKIEYIVQDLTQPDQSKKVHFAMLDLQDPSYLGMIISSLHKEGSTNHKANQIIEVVTTFYHSK